MNTEIVSKLSYYMSLAATGTARDIDMIMQDLNQEITLADSKFIDYALSLVKTPDGVDKIADYLFNGTQMRRNYCTLFFNRRCERGDWGAREEGVSDGFDRCQAGIFEVNHIT